MLNNSSTKHCAKIEGIRLKNISTENLENNCFRTIAGTSCMNHIKMDDIRSDLGIPNKIIDIITKKRLKWFSHTLHKDNTSYINHSFENGFTSRRPDKKVMR